MYHKTTPLWKVLLIMVGSTVACMGVFVFSLDEVCRANIAMRQPLYPNAEVMTTEYSLFRPRAMGITRLTLATADDPETVRQWFRDVTMDLLQREQFRGIASLNYQVHENPEGEGSLINLYSECGEL